MEHDQKSPATAFWERGFRPFFLLGAVYSVLMISLWVLALLGHASFPSFWVDPVMGHVHEMVYGFSMAIIAGFLLTAVANWTSTAPVHGVNLKILVLVWFVGRVCMWAGIFSPLITAIIDLSFIPLLAVNLALPLLHARNARNFIFLGLLIIFFIGNGYMHAINAGWITDTQSVSVSYAVVFIVLAVISLVGSRVIPAFTVAGLRARGLVLYQTDQRKLDAAGVLAVLFTAFLLVWQGEDSLVAGACSLTAAILHIVRMRYWHTAKSAREPMLWILQAGHGWLAVGLAVLGLIGLGIIDYAPTLGLHILTVGCIGSLTLGMMARVALGHTGRPIQATSWVVLSFYLIQASVVVRVLAIILKGDGYLHWVAVAGTLWILAFVIYIAVYARVLVSPRPDGLEA